MTFILESLFLDVLVVLILAIIIHSKYAFGYWKKRGIPLVQQPMPLVGHGFSIYLSNINPGLVYENMYASAKALGYKHCGIFQCSTPQYLAVHLEYIKNILQRDFNYFSERGFYYNEKDDPLSANLFAIGGDKWRILRRKLSPAYTSGKLKIMFDEILKCSSQMNGAIEESCRNRHTINIKDISQCFTVDVIGSCAFGIECNSFTNSEAKFIRNARKIFHLTIWKAVKILFAFSYQTMARRLGITLFDTDLNHFFKNVLKDTLAHRKINNLIRKDFLQVLIDLQNEAEGNQERTNLSLEEITAQVFIFFAAGFETSSITLAFALYELAVNPEMQEKLRDEIKHVLKMHNGDITYEAVMDMKYLNQIVQETLRKYPPVTFISRVAVDDYQMPGTNVTIEKGTDVLISILGIHHDPEYHPDPEKFDPERFSDDNKHRQLPFSYMPFGEGPRICIGLRFGLMQVKVGLVNLLNNYKFQLNRKTEVPLEMKAYSFTLTPKIGIFLDVEKVC